MKRKGILIAIIVIVAFFGLMLIPAEDTRDDQTPAEDTRDDQTPAEDTRDDQTPAEDTRDDQTPAEDTRDDQTPAEDTRDDQTPAEDTRDDQTPAEDTRDDQTPAEDTRDDQTPAEDTRDDLINTLIDTARFKLHETGIALVCVENLSGIRDVVTKYDQNLSGEIANEVHDSICEDFDSDFDPDSNIRRVTAPEYLLDITSFSLPEPGPVVYTITTNDYVAEMRCNKAGFGADWMKASVSIENLEDIQREYEFNIYLHDQTGRIVDIDENRTYQEVWPESSREFDTIISDVPPTTTYCTAVVDIVS